MSAWVIFRRQGRDHKVHFTVDSRHRELGGLPPKSAPIADMKHHSITSSAHASKMVARKAPSIFAVFRFMTNSIFWGCWTGRLAGLSPREFDQCRRRPTDMRP
jgi:hypothetical protein